MKQTFLDTGELVMGSASELKDPPKSLKLVVRCLADLGMPWYFPGGAEEC